MDTVSQVMDATLGEGAAERVLSPSESPAQTHGRLEAATARLRDEMRGLSFEHATPAERRAHALRPRRERTPGERQREYDRALVDTSAWTEEQLARAYERRSLATGGPRLAQERIRATSRESRPIGSQGATSSKRDLDEQRRRAKPADVIALATRKK
jgi:hypothetical protein